MDQNTQAASLIFSLEHGGHCWQMLTEEERKMVNEYVPPPPPQVDHPRPWRVVDRDGVEVPGIWQQVERVILWSGSGPVRDLSMGSHVNKLNEMISEAGLDLPVYT